MPIRRKSANWSCSCSTSSQTRVMIAPTVRQAMRINSVTALLDVCVANQATCASKLWVRPTWWRAQGTAATVTPWVRHDTRGASASKWT